MVQKPPCWRANYPLGHPKQKNIKLSCFVLDVPVGSLLSSMAVFVPCDRKLQRAYLFYLGVAYREAFWAKLSSLIWRGRSIRRPLLFSVVLHACTVHLRTCNIFPQLTVASWWSIWNRTSERSERVGFLIQNQQVWKSRTKRFPCCNLFISYWDFCYLSSFNWFSKIITKLLY